MCCAQNEFVQVLGKVVFAGPKEAPPAAAATAATAAPKASANAESQHSNPEVQAQADKVRDLKARRAPKEEVQAAIEVLVSLKAAHGETAAPAPKEKEQPKEKAEKKEEQKGAGKKEKAPPKEKDAGKKEPKAKEPKAAEPKAAAKPAEKPAGDSAAMKACFKEGGKKAQDIAGMATFGVHFFCVTVESADGDMKLLDKVLEGMNVEVDEAAEERKGGAGDLGKMLFNSNEHKLVIICHTPKEVTEKATAADWMEGVLKATGATVVSQTENIIKAELLNDPDNGIFTLKKRDEGLSAGFAFLRSRQLMIEDDSDDDVNYAAAAGINLNAAPGADY